MIDMIDIDIDDEDIEKRFIIGVVNVIMEVPQSAGWGTRKISGVIQTESEGLRIRGWWCKSSLSPKTGESEALMADVQGQKETDASAQAERANLHFLHLFVLYGPSADWILPCIGKGDLLY